MPIPPALNAAHPPHARARTRSAACRIPTLCRRSRTNGVFPDVCMGSLLRAAFSRVASMTSRTTVLILPSLLPSKVNSRLAKAGVGRHDCSLDRDRSCSAPTAPPHQRLSVSRWRTLVRNEQPPSSRSARRACYPCAHVGISPVPVWAAQNETRSGTGADFHLNRHRNNIDDQSRRQ